MNFYGLCVILFLSETELLLLRQYALFIIFGATFQVEDVRSDSEPEPETGSEQDESPKATKGGQELPNANCAMPVVANGVGAANAACAKKLHPTTMLPNGHASNGVVPGANGVTAVPVPIPPASNGIVHQLVSNGVPHMSA